MSDQRCPRCAAVRRPGDQWCGLCYAEFRESPPAVVGDLTLPPAPGTAPAAPASGAAVPPLIRPPDQPGAVPPAAPTPVPPAAPTPLPATQPTPTIPTQTTVPAAPPPASPFVPSTNPLSPAVPTATVPTQLPEGVAPVASPDTAAAAAPAPADAAAASADQVDPAADLKWPCSRCGALVPMTEDYCAACGQGFLAETSGRGIAKKAPLFGDVSDLNSGQKLALGLGLAIAVILGMLLLLFIGGSVFN